jgi:hypothetical protein
MNVLGGSARLDITISVNAQFELRLDHVSIQKHEATAADFDGNRLDIGHARFTLEGADAARRWLPAQFCPRPFAAGTSGIVGTVPPAWVRWHVRLAACTRGRPRNKP